MSRTKVICISGQKRSGKDTVAELLISKIKKAKRVALADPMKYIVGDMLGLTYDELEVLKNDESKPHRLYLQNLGQKVKEFFGEDCWTKYSRKVIKHLPRGSTAIISDVRFPFETKHGDLTINVIRPSIGKGTDTHASENSMVDFVFDIELQNDGTIKDLEKQVDKLIADLYASGWLT